MGTSKITLLSGTYIILGLYMFGFNSVDETTNSLAYTAAERTQSEQLARSGVMLALLYMGSNSSITSFSPRSQSTMGGTVTYSASNPATLSSSERLITSRGVINSTQMETTAVVQYKDGRWQIERMYMQAV